MRRRLGDTQEHLAEEMGCSRFWVRLMEQGKAPVEQLALYWEERLGAISSWS